MGSIGDVGAWSFCQDKIMTTGGEGGMVTTNNKNLWSKMWSFKDHGKNYDSVYNRTHPEGFRWLHESIGTNWRMMEIQAVLGRIQLEKMPVWHIARTANAARLKEVFTQCGGNAIRVSDIPADSAKDGTRHAWYKFYAFVDEKYLKPNWNRDRIVASISSKGVPCQQGTCSEIYLEKAFEGFTVPSPSALTAASELGSTSILMLVHPTLTKRSMDKACDVVARVLCESIGP